MTTYARPSPPPINTLPVELLSYIFTLGTHATAEPQPSGECGNDPEGAPAFTTENVKMPLVLASVSRYWRRVALNTPSLWTSFCITLEMVHPSQDQHPSSSSSTPSSLLDTRHITSYLALSRHYPIDILIDARDQDWDFLEEEVTPDPQSYRPPFSVTHIQTVLSLFLPHLSRWRSLNILTDTWKPMQAAMQLINPAILQHGAPQLESLTLMRCNDFISFSPEFEPKSLKSPAFLSSPTSQPHSSPAASRSILPRLRYLSLRGVHVDWTSLGAALSFSKTGLYSLELCSHCSDVRPSLFELHNLLSCSPRLRRLVISGSGPSFPDHIIPDEGAVDIVQHEFEGVLLPNLGSLTVGYRSALEGQTVLQLVSAPNLKSLVLEEATYPADPEVIDAGSLLTYLGTGEFHSVKERYLVAYDLPNSHGFQYQVKTRKDSTATCVGSGIEIGGRLVEVDDDDETLVDFDTKPHPPFPLLENVVLKNVRTSSTQPIASFFGAVRDMKRLELVGMSMRPLYTLLPNSYADAQPPRSEEVVEESPGASSSSSAVASSSTQPPASLPCPHLRSISLQECNYMQLEDLNFILNNLVSDRKHTVQALPHAHLHRADDAPESPESVKCSLEDIEIQLGPNAPIAHCKFSLSRDGQVASIGDILEDHPSFLLQKDGVRIEVRRQVSPFLEEDFDGDDGSSEEDGSSHSEADEEEEGDRSQGPFSQGGAFNDPYFDAYYTGAPWLSSRS
ncbi:hypothetical protein EST38_g8503 [Candolleomyces aberdarensis]|uniref:Uncharacterized protein n=1 Tax=Candolleomyces aberdarensis TaxID=2316362 RepID=A0A4Q2DF71_9AGAR|nr:hypothetical protein EST38_g8503 [Candolleomyces aberdarensis]